MKSKILIANIIFLAAFFLVSLGVRLPSLDHTRDPKPRPRAVIENVSKSPIAFCCHQQVDAEICPQVTVAIRTTTITLVTREFSYAAPIADDFIPSRASPSLLS